LTHRFDPRVDVDRRTDRRRDLLSTRFADATDINFDVPAGRETRRMIGRTHLTLVRRVDLLLSPREHARAVRRLVAEERERDAGDRIMRPGF
jgi:hypothetical protein